MLRPQTPDPLLSASDKSGQKRFSAHSLPEDSGTKLSRNFENILFKVSR
ncbi:hypothetical protein II582_03550 [bacterium]|nr:hypothetical protein [bacterium]